jgi:hypothetical protein
MTEGRLIDKDTSPFERFQVGDEVAHITLGDGIVTANTGDEIQVTYSMSKSARAVATYNASWFKTNPRFLFHRGEITPLEG